VLELKRQQVAPPQEARPRAYVVYVGKNAEMKDAAVGIVAELRHASIKAEMGYGDRSTKSQMKQANASGSAYAIVIGEDEMAGGYVTVQDLRADKDVALEAKQMKVRRDGLVEYMRKA
jgi:histidyl-tRNA synthetase